MAKRLTKQQRLELLELYKIKEKIDTIAKAYNIDRATVFRIVKKFKETGEV